MAMYGIVVIPLICRLTKEHVEQLWFADDASAGAQLIPLREWWDQLHLISPDDGYRPNASKTWLIVKEDKLKAATATFLGTGINITTQGKRHLGAALGTRKFVEEFVQQKVMSWVEEIDHLSSIAIAHPHVAYAAFTYGLSSRWTYMARTIPDVGDLLKPLEESIRHHFLTSLTGQSSLSTAERDLLALPVCLGSLGIANPTRQTVHHHNTSQKVTPPLVALILQQSHTYSPELKDPQRQVTHDARRSHQQQQMWDAAEIQEKLPNDVRRILKVSSEKGASSWLATLPIADHGSALHNGAFWDALCLRYGWHPSNLPTTCVCDKNFSMEHALNCPCGGLTSVRHNELRDITAQCLTEVCHGVGIEPPLQLLSGEPQHSK